MPLINTPNIAWDNTQKCFVDDNGNPLQGGAWVCPPTGGNEYYRDLPHPVDKEALLEDLMEEFVADMLEDEEDGGLGQCLTSKVLTVDELTEAFKTSLLKLVPE